MAQSNRDIQMSPRQRPMPHEGPPTTRDLKSLMPFLVIGMIAVAAMVIAAFFV
jgi:hypothetical protein